MIENEKYGKYENGAFCRDTCSIYEFNDKASFCDGCFAKKFHKYLDDNGYEIFKPVKLEVSGSWNRIKYVYPNPDVYNQKVYAQYDLLDKKFDIIQDNINNRLNAFEQLFSSLISCFKKDAKI